MWPPLDNSSSNSKLTFDRSVSYYRSILDIIFALHLSSSIWSLSCVMCLFFELRKHSLPSWLLCLPLAYLTLGSLPCFFLLLEALFRLATCRGNGNGASCLPLLYLFGCIPGVGLIVLWVLTGPHEEGTQFGSSSGPAKEFYPLSGCFSLGGDCGKNCLHSKGMSDCELCSRLYCGNCCGFPNSFAPTSIDNDMEEAGAK